MNEITAKNLHNFCRACLNWVECGGNLSGNLEFFPHLKNFLNLLITSQRSITNCSNSLESAFPNGYPKNLCDFCFKNLEKLEADYQKFRNLVLQSTQRIEAICKSAQKRNFVDNQSDDDDKLLLPELADWTMPEIKAEPADITEAYQIGQDIKEEIDFEFDEGSSSCEPNVLNESYVHTDEQLQENFSEDFKIRDRNKKSFKCPSCNKHAYKKVYLDAHIRKIHEGLDKPFLCSVSECRKAFTRYNQLHVHVQTNHAIDAIKFTCDIEGCNESFRLGQTLESHRRMVHKFKNIMPMEFSQVKEDQFKKEWKAAKNICRECGKVFHAKKALQEHLRRHANDKRYVCEICHVSKVTKTELITHKRVHDRSLEKFKCSLCPQEFNHKNAISRHVRVVHEGERRFKCTFCPRRFGTKNSQVCHERLHTGEKPFQCEICLKGFTQVEGLKSHMKNHDKNLRKHVCKFCSSRFITKKNLMDHEQRHLGSKPHICRICTRGFSRSQDLTVHFKQHHADELNNDGINNEYFEESSQETDQTNIESQAEIFDGNSTEARNDDENFYHMEDDPLGNVTDNE